MSGRPLGQRSCLFKGFLALKCGAAVLGGAPSVQSGKTQQGHSCRSTPRMVNGVHEEAKKKMLLAFAGC